MQDNTPFETVNHSAGHHQENSLYHLMASPAERVLLLAQGLLIEPSSDTGSRKAWFVRVPALENRAEGNDLFEGYTRGWPHLSIDCKVIKNNPALLPNHFTEEHTNASHVRTVHVYFNREGEFDHFQIKQHPRHHPELAIDITNPDLKQRCIVRAKRYQDRLNTLIEYKNQRYLDLYDESFEMQDA